MITLTTEQAQQIEEALDELRYANNTDIAKTKYYKALSTIRAARAQEQAEQEPVAWMHKCGGVCSAYDKEHMFGFDYFNIPLYAAPQPVKQEPMAFHRASFLSGYEAAQSDANSCDVPPQGWLCTRQAGHDGPCAAIADDKERELVNRAMLRLADQEAAPVQLVKQKPVAYMVKSEGFIYSLVNRVSAAEQIVSMLRKDDQGAAIHPLYAAPVPTKDLTKEEIQNAMMPIEPTGKDYFLRLAHAVIAKFKEKNRA